MKRFRILTTALLLSVCAVLPAQENEEQEYDYTFNPHFFIQGNIGGQYTLGEIPFFDLTYFNAQLGFGYEFTPSVALRLSVNGWKSFGGIDENFTPDGNRYSWSWNYVSPSLDLMFDLTNMIGGFNPERKLSAGLLAGIGANFVFSNKEAEDAKQDLIAAYNTTVDISGDVMEYVENRRTLYWPFRFGGFVDYHINDNWAVGLEMQANTLSDQYNSKKTWNTDWYFNGLIGVKYCFGPTHSKTPKEKMIPASQAPECPEVEPEVIKEIVEKPVEVEKTTIYEEIYYDINKDEVSRAEMYKVRRIVEFMKANPDAKIEVSSHADAATGTAEYNQKISERRANNVVKLLKDNGIDESRITYSAHGSSENMYKGEDMNLNRVSICTVK